MEAEDDSELRGELRAHAPASVRASAMRPASDRAVEAVEPQCLGRRAEGGPALDTADRHLAAGQLPPQRVAESADGRVVLDHDERAVGRGYFREPVPVEAVEPGHVDDGDVDPVLREQLGRGQQLVEHHGPVREGEHVRPLMQHRSTSGSELVPAGQLDVTR